MKTSIYLILVFLSTISFHTVFENESKTNNKTILVELFTSQGCSSCPRADEVLREIKEKYAHKNVIPLSFHVDYWDRLGWKDTFSKAKYSDRQRAYAARFNNRSIYTPQMIINGVEEFVGSNRAKAFQLINQKVIKDEIIIEGSIKTTKDEITIDYVLPKGNYSAYDLNVALVKNEETVAIKRGENWGKKITYHNIVIDFKQYKNIVATGSLDLKKPINFTKAGFSVVLFLQKKGNGPILGVKKISYS